MVVHARRGCKAVWCDAQPHGRGRDVEPNFEPNSEPNIEPNGTDFHPHCKPVDEPNRKPNR